MTFLHAFFYWVGVAAVTMIVLAIVVDRLVAVRDYRDRRRRTREQRAEAFIDRVMGPRSSQPGPELTHLEHGCNVPYTVSREFGLDRIRITRRP